MTNAPAHAEAPGCSLAPELSRRARVGAAASCRIVELDGVRLALDDEGTGDLVVCLHALGHGAGDFAGFRSRHRDRFRVLAIDWPGHGRSADDRLPPSSARYGDLLARLLDVQSPEPVILLGN